MSGGANDKALVRAASRDSRLRFFLEVKEMMFKMRTMNIFVLVANVLRINRRVDLKGWGTAKSVPEWDRLVREHELHLFLFSMIGLLCGITISVVTWEANKRKTEAVETSSPTVQAVMYLLQVAMSTSTLTSLFLIYRKYRFRIDERRREWSGITSYQLVQAAEKSDALQKKYDDSYQFSRSHLRWGMFAEMLVHAVHPNIWMNNAGVPRMYEFFQLFMFVRLYLIVHLTFIYSWPYRNRYRVLAEHPELQRSGYRFDSASVLKFFVFNFPLRAIALIQITVPVLFGFMMFLTERTTNPKFAQVETNMWFVVVTFSTVGFGDIVPVTVPGRIVAVLIGTCGIVYSIILGGVMNNLMHTDTIQRMTQDYLTLGRVEKKQRDSAARVIQMAFRFYRSRTKAILQPWVKPGHKSNYLYAAIKDFQGTVYLMSQARSAASDPVVDANINKLQYILRGSIETVKRGCDGLEKTNKTIGDTFGKITTKLSRTDKDMLETNAQLVQLVKEATRLRVPWQTIVNPSLLPQGFASE